ncbi:hypothetical protein C8R47DRAFT_1081871 [Mycena vitilis]|nr:hypothetical protein C8R47DRAFT_1081871 [Mycena vitilis]
MKRKWFFKLETYMSGEARTQVGIPGPGVASHARSTRVRAIVRPCPLFLSHAVAAKSQDPLRRAFGRIQRYTPAGELNTYYPGLEADAEGSVASGMCLRAMAIKPATSADTARSTRVRAIVLLTKSKIFPPIGSMKAWLSQGLFQFGLLSAEHFCIQGKEGIDLGKGVPFSEKGSERPRSNSIREYKQTPRPFDSGSRHIGNPCRATAQLHGIAGQHADPVMLEHGRLKFRYGYPGLAPDAGGSVAFDTARSTRVRAMSQQKAFFLSVSSGGDEHTFRHVRQRRLNQGLLFLLDAPDDAFGVNKGVRLSKKGHHVCSAGPAPHKTVQLLSSLQIPPVQLGSEPFGGHLCLFCANWSRSTLGGGETTDKEGTAVEGDRLGGAWAHNWDSGSR